ncbi:12363_t:CDS:1 [Funneliformis caledonium]|uniref:12363_t:CDS:1 n=1 Tax=Funneliformis caledonium TaxID=1117310 RepID=A0A9N9A6Z1_9GLOM|nr:12363_t:CDS:1 [Funneliformis caledonium]
MSSQPTKDSISESNTPKQVPIPIKTTKIQNLIKSDINFIEPHPNVIKRNPTQAKRKKIPFVWTVSLKSSNSIYDYDVVEGRGNDSLESGGDEEGSDVAINGN